MNTRQLLAALRATVSPIRVISANIDNDENAQSFIRDLTGKFKARYTRISRSHLLTLPAPLDHKVFGNLLLNVLKNHGGKRRSATSHWDEFSGCDDTYHYWIVLPSADTPEDTLMGLVKLYEDDREIEIFWS